MSNINKHIKGVITMYLEKDIEDFYQIKQLLKDNETHIDGNSLTVNIDNEREIFLFENEVIINLQRLSDIDNYKPLIEDIININCDNCNKVNSIDFEVITLHNLGQDNCLELFKGTEEDEKEGILFTGYTLFIADSKERPCVVEVSPMFEEENLFYTKFLSKYNIDNKGNNEIFELIEFVDEYLNDDFSNKVHNFIKRRNN